MQKSTYKQRIRKKNQGSSSNEGQGKSYFTPSMQPGGLSSIGVDKTAQRPLPLRKKDAILVAGDKNIKFIHENGLNRDRHAVPKS